MNNNKTNMNIKLNFVRNIIIIILIMLCLYIPNNYIQSPNIKSSIIQTDFNKIFGLTEVNKNIINSNVSVQTIRHNGRTYDVFTYNGSIAIERIN